MLQTSDQLREGITEVITESTVYPFGQRDAKIVGICQEYRKTV